MGGGVKCWLVGHHIVYSTDSCALCYVVNVAVGTPAGEIRLYTVRMNIGLQNDYNSNVASGDVLLDTDNRFLDWFQLFIWTGLKVDAFYNSFYKQVSYWNWFIRLSRSISWFRAPKSVIAISSFASNKQFVNISFSSELNSEPVFGYNCTNTAVYNYRQLVPSRSGSVSRREWKSCAALPRGCCCLMWSKQMLFSALRVRCSTIRIGSCLLFCICQLSAGTPLPLLPLHITPPPDPR